MTKLKNPVLSLGAKGTIGDAITFQRRHGVDFARQKPRLPYFLTLPVQYQRWLYQDYAYLWTQQSQATKQVYATAGSRYHLTGFQYWMKYKLTNLPDICGFWKLDDNAGAVTIDSSRNENTMNVVGASPGTGLIDKCFDFDGINDELWMFINSTLQNTDNFSAIAFIKSGAQLGTILAMGESAGNTRQWAFSRLLAGNLQLDISEDGTAARSTFKRTIGTIDTGWHFVGFTFALPDIIIYYDLTSEAFLTGYSKINATTGRWRIGYSGWLGWRFLGLVDNVILFNRVLDATSMARWAERRYPQ